MDVTPVIPGDRQFIDSYWPGHFRVSGQVHEGPIIVFPDRTVAWSVTDASSLDAEAFRPVADGDVEIVLLGCGSKIAFLPPSLRRALKEHMGVHVDSMDTGAACRTYNVLLAEGRRVAAALIPTVD